MNISYPLGDLSETRQILQNDFLPEGFEFVRFGIRNKRSMMLRSICYLTIQDYRKTENYDERKYILTRLKQEMIDFLKKESSYTNEQVFQNIVKKVENMSSQFKVSLHVPDDSGIIGGYFTFEDQPEKGYPFFSDLGEKIRADFKSNSNIFSVNNFDNISDYLEARINYRYLKNELQGLSVLLEQEKIKCDYVLSKTDEFKIFQNVLQKIDPTTIVRIIDQDQNFEFNKDALSTICSIIKMNICLLRAWSDNVSVENYDQYDPRYPTILIFMIKEGYYGIDGNYTEIKYVPGAVMVDQKIKYYLDPEKDELIIYQLKRYKETNNSSILEENYISFLKDKKKGISTKKLEKEDIYVPEYGKLEQIMKQDGDVDKIEEIIKNLDLK